MGGDRKTSSYWPSKLNGSEYQWQLFKMRPVDFIIGNTEKIPKLSTKCDWTLRLTFEF